MKNRFNKFNATIILILGFIAAKCQDFEIRAVNKGGGIVGVEMRQTASLTLTSVNYITDIVFGVKWDTGYKIGLANTINTQYNIKKSGGTLTKGKYNFQAFYADNTPYTLPGNWLQNNWVEIINVSNTMNGTGKGTFEICEAGFDATTNTNIGVDLVDYTPVINGKADDVLLPLNITSFTATAAKDEILLNWSVENEIDIAGYEIERSETNTLNFITQGFVSAINKPAGEYLFADKKVTNNTKYYYRLKQMYKDGTYNYSDVRYASLKSNANLLFQLYPNPAKNVILLSFPAGCQTGKVAVKIFDAGGVLVTRFDTEMSPGASNQINITKYSSGHYFLYIESKNEIIYQTGFEKL